MWKLTLISFCAITALANPTSLIQRDGGIPSSAFNSQKDFETYFNYNYPWGDTHNGAAKMDHAHVALGGGQLTLTANPVSGQGNIHYLSGTVHAKEHITIPAGGGWKFSGKFKAPTIRGTWPACWLTAVTGWPPEIDLAEWKGSGLISFNSYGMDKVWHSKNVPYDQSSFQSLKMDVMDLNGVDLQTKFYMNGVLQDTQIGKGMVGKPFWFIFDYQMEGSSGSPGPTYETKFAVKDFSAQPV